MPTYVRIGIIDEIRMAIDRADREGTAALNALMVGVMSAIAASVALVAIDGVGGFLAFALVWLSGIAVGAIWIAPHLVAVQRSERLAESKRRESVEAARRRAVDVILDDDLSVAERRSAAEFLISGDG